LSPQPIAGNHVIDEQDVARGFVVKERRVVEEAGATQIVMKHTSHALATIVVQKSVSHTEHKIPSGSKYAVLLLCHSFVSI